VGAAFNVEQTPRSRRSKRKMAGGEEMEGKPRIFPVSLSFFCTGDGSLEVVLMLLREKGMSVSSYVAR
jgi:hypothetical protein